jgi:DNA-directed RNA polymerase subunit RPC12/RpoP
MKKQVYRCTQCGHIFEVENVMTTDEAREQQMRLIEIRCPRCQSTQIKER